MTLNFLCSDCRSWLTQNPSEIPPRCHSGYQWANAQYRSDDLDDALNSIGSAFEMAEIMHKANCFPREFSSDWLVATSELLVRVLREMGRPEDSKAIHCKTTFLLSDAGNESEVARLTPKLARIARDAYGSQNYLRVVH